MNKILLSLMLVAALVSCNDYEDSFGYRIDVSSESVENVIDADADGYTVQLGHPVALVDGNAEISDVYFKLDTEGEEKVVKAKKEGNLYILEEELPYERYVNIYSYAIVNGEEQELHHWSYFLSKYSFAPEITNIRVSTRNLGSLTVIANYSNPLPNKKLTEAYLNIGSRSYKMTVLDGEVYCNVDLYDLGYVKNAIPLLTLGNDISSATQTPYCYITNNVYSVENYDTSDDGKTVDGCLYLAGTKWGKGMLVEDNSGKYSLDKNTYLGDRCFYYPRNTQTAYCFQGEYDDPVTKALGSDWMTPTKEQMEKLLTCCSIQRICTETSNGGKRWGYVVYPAKGNRRVECDLATDCLENEYLTSIRDKGVYMEVVTENVSSSRSVYYGTSTLTDVYKNHYGEWYFYLLRADLTDGFTWGHNLIAGKYYMPIKK